MPNTLRNVPFLIPVVSASALCVIVSAPASSLPRRATSVDELPNVNASYISHCLPLKLIVAFEFLRSTYSVASFANESGADLRLIAVFEIVGDSHQLFFRRAMGARAL